MKGLSLCFSCCLYLIGVMCIGKAHAYGTGGRFEYSNAVSTEQEVSAMQPVPGAIRPWVQHSEFMKNPTVMQPYHVFPMFQHVPGPLVDMELFRPVSGRRQLPNRLTSLLVPKVRPHLSPVSPVRNARGVEVWCGYSKISVRVRKSLLGFKSSPSSLHLGTCPVSRSDNDFLYFHYNLNACNSTLMMTYGQVMYSNMVHYTPEPQGTVIRAVPLALDIQCLYNRFHYSYKIGFVPVLRELMFHKSLEHRGKFNIYVLNERWERMEEDDSFMLGEPMYFEVRAAHTFKDEIIFVDSCHVTASKDPNSTPKYSVISNYGCMEDSRRQGSLSRFLQRELKVIRFSFDAFLFPQVTDKHIYLHCTMSVHNATSATAKSCTYNNAERRWNELYSDASICACCDSTCEMEATSSLPHVTQSLMTSLPWILDQDQSLVKTKKGLVDVQEDTEEEKFKSAEEFEEDDYNSVEIMTDAEKQMEAEVEEKKILMKDRGTVETAAVEVKHEADQSVEVKSFKEQKDRVVELEEDVGGLEYESSTELSNVLLMEELLGDVNDKGSNESEQNELTDITREQLSEYNGFEENMHVQSTVPSHIVMDENVFLNAKQEPMEWSNDVH